MGIVDRYKEIFKGSTIKENATLVAYIPKPTSDDYTRGYIMRFFVQKTSDINSPIIEVSYNNYLKLKTNPYYRLTKLRWKISGSLNPIYDSSGVLEETGVPESNRISIKLASQKIKNLKLYLPNLLQFYK